MAGNKLPQLPTEPALDFPGEKQVGKEFLGMI